MGKKISGVNCIITESILFLLRSTRFMIIVPTGIPMIPRYVLTLAGWLELDSEEDGVPLEYQRPQS